MNLFGIWLCLSAPQQAETPTLDFYQDSFIVRLGAKKAEVPLQLPREKPPLSVSFRKNNNFAVWDDRGLTIRIGKQAKSLRLEEFVVSPKIFTRDEIITTVADLKAGKRKRPVAALSGARRIGSVAYFLTRWEDSAGKTWLETLVSVDLAKPTFHPNLLARLPGHSLASKPIDDDLILLGNRMSSVVKRGETWGLATYDSKTQQFEYSEIGKELESYMPVSERIGAYVEKSSYGSRFGGRVDLAVLTRKNLVECKGALRFADGKEPLLAISNRADTVTLRNTDTGAEVTLQSSAAMRRTPFGIVVWSPYKSPKRAWLYDPSRWTAITQWSSEKSR